METFLSGLVMNTILAVLRFLPRLLFLIAIASPSVAAAESCSWAVVRCLHKAVAQSDNKEKCEAAGDQCRQTGTFIVPYSGIVLQGFTKK